MNPDTWPIGDVALGATTSWEEFTATNDGNVTEDFTINGEDGDGGWTIQSAADVDAFVVQVDSPPITLSFSDQTLADNVAPSGDKIFSLRYHSPTSDTWSADTDQDFHITIKASKH